MQRLEMAEQQKALNRAAYRRYLFSPLLALVMTGCGPGSEPPRQAPLMEVQVAQSQRTDVPLSIEMVGTTLGTQDVAIRTRVEGFLESMDFREGTFVEKGQLLYTIDPQPFQAKLVEAQSRLAGARTSLAKAESDLARIRPLAEMKAVSAQDLDGAVAQAAAARAAVQAEEAAVELAEIELGYTRIHSPINGLIGLTKARPGEFVGRDPNPVVLTTLSDIDPIRVRFSISEREYLIMARTYLADDSHAREGGRARRQGRDLDLILADGTEHTEKGSVVAASQSIDQETGTFTVEASFPNPEKILLPGQFARVRALYQVLSDVVVVPKKAVSEMQGLFRVYVVNDNDEVAAKTVQLGPETGDDVVVESGLDAGERVIVEGIQKVRPGMTVRVAPAGQAQPG
jgi:membrane fusion protein (multidrug efflux system)